MEIREVEGSGGTIFVSDEGGVFALNHAAFMSGYSSYLIPLEMRMNGGYLYIHIPAVDWNVIDESYYEAHGVDFAQMKRFSLMEPYFVHRLVCRAFHGESPAKGMVVDHINGITTDNRADNLRWLTTGENLKLGRWRKKECPHVFGLNVSTGSLKRFLNLQAATREGYVIEKFYEPSSGGKVIIAPYNRHSRTPIQAYLNNENLIRGYVSEAYEGGGIGEVVS